MNRSAIAAAVKMLLAHASLVPRSMQTGEPIAPTGPTIQQAWGGAQLTLAEAKEVSECANPSEWLEDNTRESERQARLLHHFGAPAPLVYKARQGMFAQFGTSALPREAFIHEARQYLRSDLARLAQASWPWRGTRLDKREWEQRQGAEVGDILRALRETKEKKS